MLTRCVLASESPLAPSLTERVPAELTVQDTDFGVKASATFDCEDPASLREELRALAGPVAVGVITGPLVSQPAQLLMMDVDSTLTTTEAIDLLADKAGSGASVAEITEQAMRGELDFAQSLHARVETLAGLPAKVLADVAPKMTLSPGARPLVLQLHEAGVWLGVTSGGFYQLVEPLAVELGLEFSSANMLEIATIDGVDQLTGRVLGDVVDAEHKAKDLEHFRNQLGVAPELTVAVGDGANDLKMLAAAGLGIAYCAKPVTAAAAHIHIPFPRLDAVAAFALVD